MSIFLDAHQKDKDEAETYTVDWTARLRSGATISSVSWSVPSGITNAAVSITGNSSNIRLSGGTVGQTYKIEPQMTDSASNTPQVHFTVTITD
jgi:hypothetical protein